MDTSSPAEAGTHEVNGDEIRKPGGSEAQEPKQIYLRTVYPLNPGIPHFVDVPGGW